MTTDQVGPGGDCLICGNNEVDHKTMEKLSQLHHKWSGDGQLRQTEPEQRGTRPASPPATVVMVPGIDISLRQLLRNKGVLTDEDIAALGASGPGTPRDGEAGSAQSPS